MDLTALEPISQKDKGLALFARLEQLEGGQSKMIVWVLRSADHELDETVVER